jgi:hypothetical protein
MDDKGKMQVFMKKTVQRRQDKEKENLKGIGRRRLSRNNLVVLILLLLMVSTTYNRCNLDLMLIMCNTHNMFCSKFMLITCNRHNRLPLKLMMIMCITNNRCSLLKLFRASQVILSISRFTKYSKRNCEAKKGRPG